MIRWSLSKTARCMLLIFLSFWWTSSAYLAWMYRLMDLGVVRETLDLCTNLLAYVLQALGLGAFAWMVHRRPALAEKRAFLAAVGLDLLCLTGVVLLPGVPAVLGLGLGMNFLHGMVAGWYLYRLTLQVEWKRRGLAFGLGYGLASVLGWAVSLPAGGALQRGLPALGLCLLVAALSGLLLVGEQLSAPKESTDSEPSPARTTLALAGVTLFLLSLVKSLGFGFPSADLGQGVSLELSRAFYAVGLVIAGLVSDRDRKYGAICCAASLGVPFLMLTMSGQVGPSVVLWALNYLLFGFFTVFRVIFFSDLSEKYPSLLAFSGCGLLFGRLGDAAGAGGNLLLAGHRSMLVAVTAVLFAAAIVCFLLLYQKIYLPAPIRVKSEEERFGEFAVRYGLSAREQEVLKLLLAGQSNKEIGDALFVSERTVKYHMHNLLEKTGAENRGGLVALYRRGD